MASEMVTVRAVDMVGYNHSSKVLPENKVM
jgi:hypothetical protein